MSSNDNRAKLISRVPQQIGTRTAQIYTYLLDRAVVIGTDDRDEVDSFMTTLARTINDIAVNDQVPPTAVFSIRFLGSGGHYYQTRFMSLALILENARASFNALADKYKDDDDTLRNVPEFQIMWIDRPGQAIMAQSGKFGVRMIRGDCIVSPGSDINCGFTALALGLKFARCIREDQAPLFFDSRKLNTIGAKFKLRFPEYQGADCCSTTMFDAIAKKSNIRLRIFDTDLTHIIMEGGSSTGIGVELCYFGGHISTIIRRGVLDTCPMIEFEQKIDKALLEVLQEDEPEMDHTKTTMTLVAALEQEYGAEDYTVEMIEDFLNDDTHCVLIPKKFTEKLHNVKIAAWDSETTNHREDGTTMDQKPYSCGWAYYDYCGKEDSSTDQRTPWKIMYSFHSGFNCLSEMMEKIHQNIAVLNGYTFYAHNSSKFDMHVFFQHGMLELKDWKIRQLSTRGGAILKVTFESKTNSDHRIYFLDSVRLIPGPLADLLKECKTQHQKLDFDHTKVNEVNCLLNPDLESYQRNDVVGLLELIVIFSTSVWSMMNVNITSCLTAASMAKRNFFQNYYNPYKNGIYKLPTFLDKYIRSGYNGGRVEATKIGYMKGKFYYYDVTSLYPAEATRLLPYGVPVVHIPESDEDLTPRIFYNGPTGQMKLRGSIYGFIRVKVKGPTIGKRPLHSIYSNDKLMFPIFEEWTETVLFSEEIRMACDMELGYQYQVVDWVAFGGHKILKDVMEKGFEKKAEEAKNGNHTNAGAQKIVINSTYGFFGLVVDELDSIKLYMNTDPVPIDDRIGAMLVEDRFKSYLNVGDYHLIRGSFDLRVKDFNVGIAAAITAYSRMTLYRIMDCFEKDGGNIYYYDTDSVITDKNIKECPTVMRDYQTDGCGDALGMLKNECTAILNKKHKDTVVRELQVEPEPYFDELVLLGCKNYAVRRNPRFQGGASIVILKMKGINKKRPITAIEDPNGKLTDKIKEPRFMNFDDYILLTQGYIMSQHQEQFKAGYGTMMSAETKGGSRIVTVKKKLSMLYNKGLLHKIDEFLFNVTPLTISNRDDFDTGRMLHRHGRFGDISLKPIVVKTVKKIRTPGTKRKTPRENTSRKK
jgi:hypothetical protein